MSDRETQGVDNSSTQGFDADEFCKTVVQIVREPMLVLDSNLLVRAASHAFYSMFDLKTCDAEHCHLLELAEGRWNIQELQQRLSGVLSSGRVLRSFLIEQDFERIGRRALRLDACRVKQLDLILLTMEDITAQQQLVQDTRPVSETVENKTSETRQILHDVTQIANEAQTVEEALTATLQRLCNGSPWQVGHVWQRDGEHNAMLSSGIWFIRDSTGIETELLQKETSHFTYADKDGFVGDVLRSGRVQWIDDVVQSETWQRGDPHSLGLRGAVAIPVKVESKVAIVLECFSDQPQAYEQGVLETLPDLGIQLGHLIERKRLERSVADAVAAQQKNFAQELHDSISQELTGVSMMAGSLHKQLQDIAPEHADLLGTLIHHLREAQKQIRRLSLGLRPVDVDPRALYYALRELADSCQQMHGIQCIADCSPQVTVEDTETSTEMYRIAQEALQNAVKHSHATQLRVTLKTELPGTVMIIEDNGCGLPRSDQRLSGSGLRIMRYRANLIGASLVFETQPGEGLSIVCRLPKRRKEASIHP